MLPWYITEISELVWDDNADSTRFPGPAPLHYTLLSGQKYTGVTLQTLDPTHFDKGKIIAQTPYPGIEHGTETVEELRDLTAPIGASMLVDGLRNKRFIPPIVHAGWANQGHVPTGYVYAGKIRPSMRHIDWENWSTTEILRKQRVIGPLWNTTEALIGHSEKESTIVKRIIWENGFRILDKDCHLFPSVGHPIIIGLHSNEQK
ncbi:MAG: hypothetical protein Q9174_005128, partial [Haloplaca sp. 1 TL-2023]